MSAQQDTRKRNGTADAQRVELAERDRLAEALAYEAEIAVEAAQIRGNARELTPELFMQLHPLLRRPIPEGFIVSTAPAKGKPYESTGIRSLQVQINRMDAVLTPLWWTWRTEWMPGTVSTQKGERTVDGALAEVVVTVRTGPKGEPLLVRKARGGVDQASTVGNLFKGSETNAAKLALARVGPGHEIYVGATDLDPDVSPEAAEAQAREPVETVGTVESPKLLNAEQVKRVEKGIADAGLSEHLPMKLRSLGLEGLTVGEVTAEHATALYEWCHGADTPEPKDGDGG